MRRMLAAAVFLAALGALGAEEVVWNGGNKFAGIRLAPGVSIREDAVRQEVTGPDSQIVFTGRIDAKRLNSVEIVYRAEGIPARTSGQIFFIEQNKRIDGKTFWKLPSLKGDGEWHVIRLTASEDAIANYPAWRDAALPVTAIRLDMLDQGPGGFVEIKSIRFYANED